MSYQVKSGGDERLASCVWQTGHGSGLPDVKHTPTTPAAAIVPAWTMTLISSTHSPDFRAGSPTFGYRLRRTGL